MGKPYDLRVEGVEIEFRAERLAVPLQLSRGPITATTYAVVTVQARTRLGTPTTGVGAILLSELWAFPEPRLTQPEKAGLMRRVCEQLAAVLTAVECADPLQIGFALEKQLPALGQEVAAASALSAGLSIPMLALLNCLAPFDAALHDAWGRALGRPAYLCYTEEFLSADLSACLGADFVGCYPGPELRPRRTQLWVQHVVGLSDPLTPAEVDPNHLPPSGLPPDLQSWIRRDQVRVFKLKAAGRNPAEDAQRLADVYRVASETLAALGVAARPRLSCDPNEGYVDVAGLVELLDRLASDHPAAFAALAYLEQPTPRDLARYNFTLEEASRRKPILVDESLDRLEHLPLLRPLGWSGLAVKTCKGHTHSLLAYCWARRHHLYITIQDLTNPGRALVHSANLASYLALAYNDLECNSRQYMPAAAPAEQAAYRPYFQVVGGAVLLPSQPGPGLY
jgi:L-alanine-DL-glutamate epimerase-like enolase superfamily enzyme